jgi:hypothetical protein
VKLRYSIPEFCELSGLSRSKTYERIRTGQLAVVKDGHQTFVMHDEAVRYTKTAQPAAYPKSTQATA